MTKITYMPTAHDNDEVVVSGVTFHAYQETHVEDSVLAAKLKQNPWFTDDVVDEARHQAWSKVRAAQQDAELHREEAERLGANLP